MNPMTGNELTPELLAAGGGVLLSLFFHYIPGLRVQFDKLDPQQKALSMAAAILVLAVGAFALNCGGYLGLGIECSDQGFFDLMWLYIVALTANQSTHSLAKNRGVHS
jgi:hypothetical protein